MRARLAKLWNVRSDVAHPEELYVTVRIRLNPDRRLAVPPEVVSTGSSPEYQAAADAAVRAVLQGQPYTMLRDDTYEQWKYMDIDFDPKQMFRGRGAASTAGEHTLSSPSPVASSPPPSTRWWCDSSKNYYPTVSSCRTSWRAIDVAARQERENREIRQRDEATKKALESIKWKRIEADNGAAFVIDTNSITHDNSGRAYALTCIVDNNTCPPLNMRNLQFDCHGHYRDVYNGSEMLIAPPRSVVGQMAALACVGAKDTRFADDSDHPSLSGTTPAEYCQGLSPDACARVTAMVNDRTLPPCKSGYGLVGSGYTPEQRRACSVRGTMRAALPPALVSASATPPPSKPGETVIGQWSGKGNGKSNQFRVESGPWEFRVKSADGRSGGIYKVSDRTSVYEFFYGEGERHTQLTSSGDLYFVIKTTGDWTVTVVSFSPPVR
jgi:hypothetical protein